MCADCGCGDPDAARLTLLDHPGNDDPGHDHLDHDHLDHDHLDHDHAGGDQAGRDRAQHHHSGHEHVGHDHTSHEDAPTSRSHDHRDPASSRTIDIEQAVLAKNDRLAEANRKRLRDQGITAVNLMSSPGSGKTSLLERTVRELAGGRELAVIEGDQETLLDAERIRATGCPVVQINTGAGCHLDASMLARAIDALDPRPGSLLFVENVGNLVCPALFDLGESSRVVVISVTEGDDKPLKYPHMFASADLVVINKTDLLPYVDFDVQACADRARSLNPALKVLTLSVRSGEGMERWYSWLASKAYSLTALAIDVEETQA